MFCVLTCQAKSHAGGAALKPLEKAKPLCLFVPCFGLPGEIECWGSSSGAIGEGSAIVFWCFGLLGRIERSEATAEGQATVYFRALGCQAKSSADLCIDAELLEDLKRAKEGFVSQ